MSSAKLATLILNAGALLQSHIYETSTKPLNTTSISHAHL
jgi:hypothetical protein